MSKVGFRWGRPKAWAVPKAQGLKGPYEKNEALARLSPMGRVDGAAGPESLAVASDGTLYSGYDDGRIVQFTREGRQIRELTRTGGRPLGLRFHPNGDLLVCDAERGLLRVNPMGDITVLATEAEGIPFGLADDLDVDQEGRCVYFSDATSCWSLADNQLDLIEHGGHGRLLCHDLITGSTRVLMRDLQFANGVTLGPDDACVLVVETGMYRVHRFWLKGDRAGQHEVWLDDLPGFPDNVRFNGRDRFWVAIPAPRNRLLDLLAPFPALRFCVIQLARWLPTPVAHAAIALAFDLDGKLVANLQSHRPGGFHFITQVLETDQWLYCSSLHAKTFAGMPWPASSTQPAR